MNMRPLAEDGYNLRCELAHQTGQVSEAAGRNGCGTLKYGEKYIDYNHRPKIAD